MKKIDSIPVRPSILSVGIRDKGEKCQYHLPHLEGGFPHWNRSDLLFTLSFISQFTSYTVFLDYLTPGHH